MKEQKKLSDYLHLYLGCQFVMRINNTEKLTGQAYLGVEAIAAALTDKDYKINPILLLRPLSDMTEDELLELARMHRDKLEWKIIEGSPVARTSVGIQERFCFDADIPLIEDIENNIFGHEKEGSRYPTNISAAELTRYLLSRHFDLFGLIESGLAIDKTTYKQP